MIGENKSFTLSTLLDEAMCYEQEKTVCFRPKTANCTEYTEDDKSATLTLGYHYGDGGDAALILEKEKLLVLNDQGGAL